MTRLAFAGKCGDLGASGEPAISGVTEAAPNACGPSRLASPNIPNPNPQRVRKSRRVRNRSCNRNGWCPVFILTINYSKLANPAMLCFSDGWKGLKIQTDEQVSSTCGLQEALLDEFHELS